MKLKNIKMSRQLNVSLGIILFLVMLLGGISLFYLNSLWQSSRDLYEHPVISQQAISSIQSDVLNIRLEMNGMILENNIKGIQDQVTAINSYEADAYQQLNSLYTSYLGPQSDIDNVYSALEEYKPIREETILLLQAGKTEQAAQRVMIGGVGGIQVQKITSALSIINDFSKDKAVQLYLNAQQQKNQHILQMIIVFAAILIFVGIVSVLLRKGILPPLKELAAATKAFQQGNLETRSSYESENEFGILSRSFNVMTAAVQSEMQSKEKRTAELMLANDQIKKVNQVISDAEKYYHSLIEASLDPLVTIGPNGIITDLNSATENATGLPREVLIGTDFSQYFTEPDKAETVYQQVFKDGKVFDYELKLKHNSGRCMPVLYNASVYKDDQGKTIGVVAAARDITASRKAEDELIYLKNNLEIEVKKRTEELYISNEELAVQKMNIVNLNNQLEFRVIERTAQLESANKELEALSYSISHDLKAPLRHITGYISLLVKKYIDLFPDEGRHYIENISFSARNMGELIEGLLQFSRTGRIEMNQKFLNMNEIVEALIQPTREQDAKHRIKFTIEPMPSAFADLEMIKQVWSNYIENAVKFTSKTDMPEITIGAEENDNDNIYYIKDNGAGFDMTYASKLFAVFQRLHSREDYDGTGIGLATVKRIVERHGGKVWAEGKIGEGAVFYFSLLKRKDRE